MIVVIGESGSGKSTLVKNFVEKHSDYKKIITYTTRPKRENEIDGVDYYFITQEKFQELIDANFFVEYNAYRDWFYGTALNDCRDDDKTIAILTPAGYRALKRASIDAKSVYLYVDRRSRLINLLNRGDNIEEAYRRNLSDLGQFDGLIDEADFIIDNNCYHMSVDLETICLEAIVNDIKEEKNEKS